jgi:mannose/fructose-specific phosphotransferase system component IIA
MSVEEVVQSMLTGMSGPMLLKSYAALTHRMHAARDSFEENELRVQRNTVEDEILRRMKEGS